MRGKADGARRRSAVGRITPAYAGKRGGMWVQESTLWDHPRVCGEKPARLTAKAPAGGSPPRMRGKVHCSTRVSIHHGITPAYAGKRNQFLHNFGQNGDHPRVCGEKFGISCNPSLIGESPPRVRGKAAWLPFMRITRGITPACAGKSRFHCGVLYPLWDHPRVCGEKRANLSIRQSNQGSPPRVRGKGPA